MDEHTWTIVQFTEEEKTIEVVPTTWIKGDSCHWPPYKSDKVNNLIKKCEPLNASWPTHSVSIFRNSTFDSYSKARMKAKVAENFSDLGSEPDQPDKKRTRKPKLISSSSSEESSEDNLCSLLEAPPKAPFITKEKQNSQSSSIAPTKKILNEKKNTFETKKCSDIQLPSIVASMNTIPNERDNNPEDTVTSNSTNCTNCCIQHEKHSVDIKNQLHMLRGIMIDVLNEVKEIKKTRAGTSDDDKTSIFVDENLTLPISNLIDLRGFEDKLKEEKYFSDATKELSKFGGSSPYNFIKRTLSAIIKDTILIDYSFYGKKGKKVFKELGLCNLLIESAGKSDINCDRKKTEEAIQSFIKRSAERLKAKENKKSAS